MVKVRKPVWVKGKRLGVKKTLPLPLNQTGILTLTLTQINWKIKDPETSVSEPNLSRI